MYNNKCSYKIINYNLILFVSQLQKTPMLVIPSLIQAQTRLTKRHLLTKKFKLPNHQKHLDITLNGQRKTKQTNITQNKAQLKTINII